MLNIRWRGGRLLLWIQSVIKKNMNKNYGWLTSRSPYKFALDLQTVRCKLYYLGDIFLF